MAKITRREFLVYIGRVLSATGAAALLGPAFLYFFPAKLEETPSEPLMIGALGDLPQGESKTVRFGRYPALVIHTPEGLRAYSAVCTHFACVVKWDPALGQIVCPCHEGFFDPADGHVISGPPPSALETLPVEVVDGNIYVGGAS